MSADIVNLRRFRKSKARARKDRQAEENRARFGRTSEQRRCDEDEATRRAALLDGVRVDQPPGDGEKT